MSFLNRLVVRIFATKIGEDRFGNHYYEGRNTNYLGVKKRYVIYSGKLVEPSKVPPLWHAWLHYLSNDIPSADSKKLPWQREHLPNLTGTKLAYGDGAKAKENYIPWQVK